MVKIERDILTKNNQFAAENRRFLAERGIFALNLVSSPGSGKTTLLVKTIEMLRDRFPIAVIEGDQQTDHDAARIRLRHHRRKGPARKGPEPLARSDDVRDRR